jgi:acetyl-CoA carboxylase / biotin carboxylase 1
MGFICYRAVLRAPLKLRIFSWHICSRPISQNTIGVVAWLITLRTPECPQGRRIIAVANDITFASGSFGPAEDAMFRAATEYALQERLPVVYLAANSGARVGLANEVKQCLRAAWTDPSDPSKGFKYLYLSPEDYQSIFDRAANRNDDVPPLLAQSIHEDGEQRWRLTDVIGLEDGLGVECLSGSGAIAGVYTRAFREGFTVTLVSGRTVGIGAYLARLGRRCIQRRDQPIILTGYAALNKLLGREVYTSHMQLGGPRVMGFNGVSHHVVDDDLTGVAAVLRWLSYTAARTGEAPPRLLSADPESRRVAYAPAEAAKLDPRAAIAGIDSPENPGGWVGGLFDRGSWTEAQPDWARTVVTGRARLAGVPVGVIGVEVNTMMLNLPADPGMPDSSERVIPQAGQVWFPDSALKTAQAMEEFDLEGLPLFILANWRGFSGGQRDLFEGVLQAGSLIVDNLRTYRQPVVMYIPPGCELRGGAWVVVDSQINSNRIESYADPTAHGGVLEPEGVVEIKFRERELRALMHRLDPALKSLKQRQGDGECVTEHIRAREAALMPVYHQIAMAFAEMHDSSSRMLAKGVLRGVVPWESSRMFFAARLRRRLAEEALLRHIAAADKSVQRPEARKKLRHWFLTSPLLNVTSSLPEVKLAAHDDVEDNQHHDARATESSAEHRALWQDDKAFMSWAESAAGTARIAMELKALRQRAAAQYVRELSTTSEGTDGLVRGLQDALDSNPSLMLQLRSLVSAADAMLANSVQS